MRITKSCTFCGKLFETNSAEVKRGYGKFCCSRCSRQHQVAIKPKPVPNAKCDYCGVEFYRAESKLNSPRGNGRFCCRNHKDLAYRTALTCKACGTLLTGSRKKYCSNGCQKEHNQDSYITAWKNGTASGNNGSGATLAVSSRVRQYLHEKYGSKCCKCGWAEVHPITGLIPLTINHIDGNHTNSREDNLELICPNCHALTPNYGILNTGRGRRLRHMKIQE